MDKNNENWVVGNCKYCNADIIEMPPVPGTGLPTWEYTCDCLRKIENTKIYMMIGLPGSGKSTYIKENLQNLPIVSKDEMRVKIFRKDYDQANEIYISRISQYICDLLIENNISFILDETHSKKDRRKKIIDRYKNKCKIIGIFINEKPEICKERRINFPEEIMDKKIKEFEVPTEDEGFNKLIYIDK
jgi:predicted kinase